jgi:hypothetical protein
MPPLNYVAVVVAAIVVFAFSAAYYIALRREGAKLGAAWAVRSRPPLWQVPLELAKAFVVALVVASLVALIEISDAFSAVMLALALWVGLPVVLLVGSVTQEKLQPRLAVVHAVDWLVKLIVIALVVTVWR